ncbi:hypothetical protein Cgig2_023277 [Carnegiea gigantea]|uniref:Uncharacterized protein n=1 Tax=Carnegiea gigantea TaxID=171969 RepID=A0A9Q1Q6I0_9CARY|nr:hypothetical protein Cgig2_023277 [Carnegiea gigantea]
MEDGFTRVIASNIQEPWRVLGDFNSILNAKDRVGGNVVSNSEIKPFANWFDDCELQGWRSSGKKIHVLRHVGNGFYLLGIVSTQINSLSNTKGTRRPQLLLKNLRSPLSKLNNDRTASLGRSLEKVLYGHNQLNFMTNKTTNQNIREPIDDDVNNGPQLPWSSKLSFQDIREAVFSIANHKSPALMVGPITLEYLMQAFHKFANYSRLKANLEKSQIMLSKIECRAMVEKMLAISYMKFAISGHLSSSCRKSVCKPKLNGGLGIKDFSSWNKACIAQLVWVMALKKHLLWE